MLRSVRIYPFLFALFPITHLYFKNYNQVPLKWVVVPLLTILVCTFLSLHLLNYLLKGYDRASIVLSVFWLWFFSYSPSRDLTFSLITVAVYGTRLFVLFWLLILSLTLIFLIKRKADYNNATIYLNLFGIFLLLVSAMPVSSAAFPKKSNFEVKEEVSLGHVWSFEKKHQLPDIYYIILDAYTGNEALKKYLGFDNGEFLDSLETRGFYVSPNARSNYAWTDLSLASSLNMRYLKTDTLSKKSRSQILQVSEKENVRDLIADNKVKEIFVSMGYKYVDLSIWNQNDSSLAGPSGPTGFLFNDFVVSLLNMSILQKPVVENYLLAKNKRERILKVFEFLQAAPIEGPRFVYAHFLIPHHPFVFDSLGNLPRLMDMVLEPRVVRSLYIQQLKFANKTTLAAIDRILGTSGGNSIIIIQGDHGANDMAGSLEENEKLRMSILNAFYLPRKESKGIRPPGSPVNTFRFILNSYFGYQLPMLEEDCYYSLMNSHVFRKLSHYKILEPESYLEASEVSRAKN